MTAIRCDACGTKIADRSLSETALGFLAGSACRRCSQTDGALTA